MRISVWIFIATTLGMGVADGSASDCPTFGSGIVTGEISHTVIDEASGLASSRENPGMLWVHNDSGNAPILYALDAEGFLVRTYAPTGVANVDWEALGIGPGPDPEKNYLYLGDIGDNTVSRLSITVYRIPEPTVSDGGSTLSIPGVVALNMQYPDGAHDAEALFVDPQTSDVYIVTKSFANGISGIYRYPAPHDSSSTVTLEKVGNITLPGDAIERAVTGADISPNGKEIIIRSYTRGYHWTRPEGGTVQSAFSQNRCEIPIAPEPQGEAITFTSDGMNYFTVSEMTNQPIFLYLRSPQVPALSSVGLFSLSGALVLVIMRIRRLPSYPS